MVSTAAVTAASEHGASAILVPPTGNTVRLISLYRPNILIVATNCAPDLVPQTARDRSVTVAVQQITPACRIPDPWYNVQVAPVPSRLHLKQ
ncbi:hypothetical protein FRC10_006640, partial [Ceratobasidium sp. 414]